MPSPIEKIFTAQSSPAGSEVAQRFPWWATAYQDITETTPINSQFVFRAASGTRQAFANDKPYPIYIDELRFWLLETPGSSARTITIPQGAMEQVCFRIKTDLQGEIVSRWMPGTSFNTQMNRHLSGYLHNMVWRLPAPYYLPYGSVFSVEVDCAHSVHDGDTFQCALRGWDPYNEMPTALLIEPRVLNTTITARVPVAFDDNRDRPVKSIWLQDFTMEMIDVPLLGSVVDPWERIHIKFNPPEGPLWTEDITTPLTAFCEQVSASDYGDAYNPPVIHRPPSPYILRPGDSMVIECQNRFTVAAEAADLRIWACAKGWQLGLRQ